MRECPEKNVAGRIRRYCASQVCGLCREGVGEEGNLNSIRGGGGESGYDSHDMFT